MAKEIKLKIVYEGGHNQGLDKVLEKVLKIRGWKFEGSGFDFKTEKRDLVFYKETI